jgi:hypothetical protein
MLHSHSKEMLRARNISIVSARPKTVKQSDAKQSTQLLLWRPGKLYSPKLHLKLIYDILFHHAYFANETVLHIIHEIQGMWCPSLQVLPN